MDSQVEQHINTSPPMCAAVQAAETFRKARQEGGQDTLVPLGAVLVAQAGPFVNGLFQKWLAWMR